VQVYPELFPVEGLEEGEGFRVAVGRDAEVYVAVRSKARFGEEAGRGPAFDEDGVNVVGVKEVEKGGYVMLLDGGAEGGMAICLA